MTNGDPQAELLTTIRQGVEAAIAVVDDIDTGLLEISKRLRIDPSTEAFTALSTGLSNLGDLVALVQEIRKGAAHLRDTPIPAETFSSLEKSVDLFREMQASMERKDWISLADLIQYELSPLLGKSKEDFLAIRGFLPPEPG